MTRSSRRVPSFLLALALVPFLTAPGAAELPPPPGPGIDLPVLGSELRPGRRRRSAGSKLLQGYFGLDLPGRRERLDRLEENPSIPRGTVPFLLEVLENDPALEIRTQAAELLGRHGDETTLFDLGRAADPVRTRSQGGDPASEEIVRLAAQAALETICGRLHQEQGQGWSPEGIPPHPCAEFFPE